MTLNFKRTFKRIFSCCVHRSEVASLPSHSAGNEGRIRRGLTNGTALSRLAALTVCGARIETQCQDFKLRIQGCPIFERLLSKRDLRISCREDYDPHVLCGRPSPSVFLFCEGKRQNSESFFVCLFVCFLQRSKPSSVKKKMLCGEKHQRAQRRGRRHFV